MNMNQKGFANIILVVVIVILLGAVGYFALVKKSVPVSQQKNENNLTLEVIGYGYTTGDIVRIKSALPTVGNIIVFNPFKNKSMCLGMGPSMALGKIVGLPGDSVQILSNSLKLRTQTINLDRDYSQQKVVFGGQRYQNPPTTITLKNGEYLLDKWVGQECFDGELDASGSSIPYNRFTANQEAIIGVIEGKIGHDDQAEKEFRSRIY